MTRWKLDVSQAMWSLQRKFLWDIAPWLASHAAVGRAVKSNWPEVKELTSFCSN
jgi:hypothetical protein